MTPRVLVIGGGFGGMTAARLLAHSDVELTVLDVSTSNVFAPLLYQCATGLLSEGQISRPLREVFARHRNTRVLLAEAVGIDAQARTVTARRPDRSTFELSYDYLVVAAGMRQSYFGNDEFAAFAPGMKTIDDALEVRRRIYGAFELAETLPADQRGEWLTFAVVGAGPTGVELAGQIRELATHTITREFRAIDPTEARVLLFDGVSTPLASFGPKLSARAVTELRRLGVELHMNTRVTAVDREGLVAAAQDATETRYRARTVLWTAGVQAVQFADRLAEAVGAQPDRSGRIPVRADLTIAGHDEIWVVGDMMSLGDLPGVAEVALQGGLHAATEIRSRLAGHPRRDKRFEYRDLGLAAYISRFHAVVKIGPIQLSGFIAWLIWGVIHLTALSGGRNRAAAVTSWLFAIVRDQRGERALTSVADDRVIAERG